VVVVALIFLKPTTDNCMQSISPNVHCIVRLRARKMVV
jgi:hypothetical protein